MPSHRLLAVENLETRDVPAAAFETLPQFNFSDPAVLDTARSIAATGQGLGRRADAFMKVGDSNSSRDYGFGTGYLFPLGAADYNPVLSGLSFIHPELVATLTADRSAGGSGFNSFARDSTTAFAGAKVADLLPHIAGEVAATNAGVALVMIGTNDAMGFTDPGVYRAELQSLVDTLSAMGVVPVLSTIPENLYSGGTIAPRERRINQVIADVAGTDHLPLWNLWRDLSPLVADGLDQYGVHLSVSPAGGGNFVGPSLQYGQNVRNIDALQVLDWFRHQVAGATPEPAAPFPAWTPFATGQSVYAVGRGEGQQPVVSIYDSKTGQELDRFLAFAPGFSGGVRVSIGDVNGDGVPDVVVAPGPGGGPVVKVFDGKDGSQLASFFAFEPSFRGGVSSIATGDLDGDGKAEIVVGAGVGGAPAVAVFHGGDFGQVERFFAFDPSFRGGVNIAVGKAGGAGLSIVAGAGVGGGPQVAVFGYASPLPVTSFFAFDPSNRGGVVVAAGNLDGSGTGEIAAGQASGGTRVVVIDPRTMVQKLSVFAGPSDGLGGVRLGAIKAVDGADELVVGNGPGEGVSVLAYPGLSALASQLPPAIPGRAYGIYVG